MTLGNRAPERGTSQFLDQLRRTIEGLLEAERDRRVNQLRQQGQKALQQVRVPRLSTLQQTLNSLLGWTAFAGYYALPATGNADFLVAEALSLALDVADTRRWERAGWFAPAFSQPSFGTLPTQFSKLEIAPVHRPSKASKRSAMHYRVLTTLEGAQ